MRRTLIAAFIIFTMPLAMSIVIDSVSIVAAELQGQRVDRADQDRGAGTVVGGDRDPTAGIDLAPPWYANPMWWIIGASILLVFVVMGIAAARGNRGDRQRRLRAPPPGGAEQGA